MAPDQHPPPHLRPHLHCSPLHIVKLGGSLIANKGGYCQLNRQMVERLGNELAQALAQHAPLPLIVLGGGSFGNGIPLRYGLDQPGFRVKDLSRMPFGMHQLMSEVASLWRERGIAVFPLQASAMVSVSNRQFELNPRPIFDALAQGLIPLTSGDLILSDPPCILSSDHIPALVAQRMPVARVTFLTDVCGLLDRSRGNAGPVRRVTLESAESALALAGRSALQDVTGGMKTKVRASLELLQLGVESEMVDGRIAGVFRRVLGGQQVRGTHFSRMASVPHALGGQALADQPLVIHPLKTHPFTVRQFTAQSLAAPPLAASARGPA